MADAPPPPPSDRLSVSIAAGLARKAYREVLIRVACGGLVGDWAGKE